MLRREKKRRLQRLLKEKNLQALAWISDRELLFYKNEPLVYNVKSNEARPLLNAEILAHVDSSAPLKYFTARPEMRLIAVSSAVQILLLEWTDSKPTIVRHIQEGLDHDGWEISPDGSHLAYTPFGGDSLKIAGVNDEKVLISILGQGGSPWSVDWSADSASLIFIDADGGKIVNKDGSGLRTLTVKPGQFSSLR